jgi:hypothetical protein
MKYSVEQIKEKAQQFMKCLDAKDHRCHLMLMMLAFATGVTEENCIERIKELAKK